MPIFLDTGVLGMLVHPHSENSKPCVEWIKDQLNKDETIYVPEVCDFELRRELIRRGATKQLSKLDDLKANLNFVIIQSHMMLKAAELWATSRNAGHMTADPKELDGDVILAAQAIITDPASIVATTNVGHLSFFLAAEVWQNI